MMKPLLVFSFFFNLPYAPYCTCYGSASLFSLLCRLLLLCLLLLADNLLLLLLFPVVIILQLLLLLLLVVIFLLLVNLLLYRRRRLLFCSSGRVTVGGAINGDLLAGEVRFELWEDGDEGVELLDGERYALVMRHTPPPS